MECIYFDKNSIVWEFPREIQDSLFFTGNNEMFNIYHKRLKNIYEIVINSVNKDNVKLLYNGMPFVEIKKQYTKGIIFNNLFINTLAEFDAINKKIYLYSGRLSGSSLNHELLHLLSSYYADLNKLVKAVIWGKPLMRGIPNTKMEKYFMLMLMILFMYMK